MTMNCRLYSKWGTPQVLHILDSVHLVSFCSICLLQSLMVTFCSPFLSSLLFCAFPDCFCWFLPFLLLPAIILPFWACCGVFVPCGYITLEQEVGVTLRLLLLPAVHHAALAYEPCASLAPSAASVIAHLALLALFRSLHSSPRSHTCTMPLCICPSVPHNAQASPLCPRAILSSCSLSVQLCWRFSPVRRLGAAPRVCRPVPAPPACSIGPTPARSLAA